MKLRLVQLCVFLVLGTIVNVGIAWGFEMTRTWNWSYRDVRCEQLVIDDLVVQFRGRERTGTSEALWLMMGAKDPDEQEMFENSRHFLLKMDQIQFGRLAAVDFGPPYSWLPPPLSGDELVYSNAYAYGWPALSLAWMELQNRPGAAFSSKMDGGWVVRSAGPSFRPYVLPLKPLWRGFAINTLFYAAVCWLLFAAPSAYRRWRRVRRGLCPACGYPTGTSDRCTECGRSVIKAGSSGS